MHAYLQIKGTDKCYVERVVIKMTILTCGGHFPEKSNSMIKVYKDTIILPLNITGDIVL